MAVLTFYGIKKNINIGWVMLANSFFVFFLARMPLQKGVELVLTGIFSYGTIKLILIMTLIMMIENIMRKTGMIAQIAQHLKQLLGSNRIASTVVPAVIGLLPSPGGARFSCPMLDEMVADNGDGKTKAFVNFWFRHVWMDGFILYPGIILAAELMQVSVLTFFLHLLVFIVVTAVMGMFLGTFHIKKERIARSESLGKSFIICLKALSPVLITILLYVFLLKYTSESLIISVAAVAGGLVIYNKYDLEKIRNTIAESFQPKFVIIIVGVMVFKEMLLGSKLLEGFAAWMEASSIPKETLYLLLPAFAGAATGITVGAVSLVFPILLTLGLGDNVWYGVMAFAAMSVGQMVTPMHLCMVITTDYFHVPVNRIIKRAFLAEVPLISLLIIILLFIIR